MAFLGKVGNMIIRQSAMSKNPSLYPAVRYMSSVPNSKKTFIGGVPCQSDEHGSDLKDRARMMNNAIYSRGYGIRGYSSGVGAASVGTGVAISGAVVGLVNVPLFWHINQGIKEILDDYVHHEMTRTVMLVNLRLFLIIAAKDVFVSLVF